MLDVCLINQAATTPEMPGGSRHFDFAKELTERYGCRVTIVAAARNHLTRRHSTAALHESDYRGVRFLWIRTAQYESNDWRRLLNMASFAANTVLQSKALGSPDVIIGSTPQMLSALSALIIARRTGARFILEVRDLWPQALVDLGVLSQGSITTRLLRNVERILCRHASKIIVLARGSKDYMLSLGIPAERVVYIPNGVDLSSFEVTEERTETRKRMSVNGHLVAMYAGAHGAANGLETLLETAKELRKQSGLQIILVGDGPSKRSLEAVASEEHLDNVRFLDAVPKREIPNLLNAADILVITLKDVEAFKYGVSPNKIFDYMAAGRPVICAVGGEMMQMIHDADAGLVVAPEDPAAMAEAIVQLYESPVERDRLGENGRQYVRRFHSREQLASRLFDSLVTH